MKHREVNQILYRCASRGMCYIHWDTTLKCETQREVNQILNRCTSRGMCHIYWDPTLKCETQRNEPNPEQMCQQENVLHILGSDSEMCNIYTDAYIFANGFAIAIDFLQKVRHHTCWQSFSLTPQSNCLSNSCALVTLFKESL